MFNALPLSVKEGRNFDEFKIFGIMREHEKLKCTNDDIYKNEI
jgi:hypothetical protein